MLLARRSFLIMVAFLVIYEEISLSFSNTKVQLGLKD